MVYVVSYTHFHLFIEIISYTIFKSIMKLNAPSGENKIPKLKSKGYIELTLLVRCSCKTNNSKMALMSEDDWYQIQVKWIFRVQVWLFFTVRSCAYRTSLN